MFEAVLAGTDTRIKRKSAKNGPYVRVADNGDITFAAAITGIPAGNYTSGIYTYAYAAWTNEAGDVTYTQVTYTSTRTGKAVHSLYDMTIFAFRSGIVNSQNTDADKLWPILEKGALTITKGDEKAINENLVEGYTFTDNKFTYLDLPLRAWKFHNKSAGSTPASANPSAR